MEITLRTDEPIDQEIKRVYLTCLQETIPIIRPPHQHLHEAIHNTRKSFKFMRALIRLIKYPLGVEDYKQQNQFFRDLGRIVSDLRDVRVMIVLMQYVATESHSVRKKDIEPGLFELQEHEQNLLDEAHEQKQFEEIANQLEENEKAFADRNLLADKVQQLLPGLIEIYKKGQEGFTKARAEGTKEHFHNWRKRVKYLLHAFQVLANYWPDELDIKGKSLHQLSDYLGDEHDLALLDDLLIDDEFSENFGNIKAMKSYVDQKRSFLQRSALNLGEFIYSKSGDEFISYFE